VSDVALRRRVIAFYRDGLSHRVGEVAAELGVEVSRVFWAVNTLFRRGRLLRGQVSSSRCAFTAGRVYPYHDYPYIIRLDGEEERVYGGVVFSGLRKDGGRGKKYLSHTHTCTSVILECFGVGRSHTLAENCFVLSIH
jgi:hypothetical protein